MTGTLLDLTAKLVSIDSTNPSLSSTGDGRRRNRRLRRRLVPSIRPSMSASLMPMGVQT